MIAIIAQRSPGDRPGPDITDQLLTTEAVARERGRNEIDAQSSSRMLYTCTGPLEEYRMRGELVELVQRDRQPLRALARSWTLTINRSETDIQVDQTLTLEAPA